MRKATLAISDAHYGDAAQYAGALAECMTRAIAAVKAFGADDIEVLCNGDMVAGRGIYRGQETQSILQLGSEQTWYAARDILHWQQQLNAGRWVFTLGNHDNSQRENLAAQLVGVLRLLGVNSYYAKRTFVGNFGGAERDGAWYLAEHGFGGSAYYANSYTEIRALWRKYIEISKHDAINLSRAIFGHTHWLNIGQRVGQDMAIDTLGGWHAQDRLNISSDVRDTGLIIYFHDDALPEDNRLTVKMLEADRKLLMQEARDGALHYRNMAAAAQALVEMAGWAHAQGLG